MSPTSNWIWLDPNPDDPERDPVDPTVALSFNEATCRELRFIAVSIRHGVINIAVEEGAHAGRAREVVMDQARCAVAVATCDPGQLDRALDRVFSGVGYFQPETTAEQI